MGTYDAPRTTTQTRNALPAERRPGLGYCPNTIRAAMDAANRGKPLVSPATRAFLGLDGSALHPVIRRDACSECGTRTPSYRLDDSGRCDTCRP